MVKSCELEFNITSCYFLSHYASPAKPKITEYYVKFASRAMMAVPMKYLFAVICAVRGRAHRVIPTPRPTRSALRLRFPGDVLPFPLMEL